MDAIPFEPDFSKGLLPVVVQDAQSLEVLMLAYMNEEAYAKTVATGEAHYFSRSRKKLWHKGEESHNVQRVLSMRLDCDSDTLLLLVEQIGGASCHTGHRSCFYRERTGSLVSLCCPMIFNPDEIYHKTR
ncbi:MAG: phosphoribosyl-AMP cyclohydrolase [Desulfovibrio sp.]|nr:phosphoribosyl-AMP cyclohydrolase [Desulfovibrio sp.]